ncbi:uncharacterized protein LOC112567301 isoform X1 [Pomacea canaliculata]|uniref:uncharacterized protein LOC112567301 isoform X1 n=1 Tax=Pomacea canaliculata TaxID=400727 RepID=UPI000D732857|nr:uncharacterized protein LOC112567301 isoform X1 [Pomacea canaliculata]
MILFWIFVVYGSDLRREMVTISGYLLMVSWAASFWTRPALSDVSLDKLLMSKACPRDSQCGTHLLNCEPDGVVKVKDAIHGFKSSEQQPFCLAGTSDLCGEGKEVDNCCKYENGTDCLQPPPISDLDLLHDSCQGKGHCLFRSERANDGPCDSSEGYTPYSAVAYECINRSLLLDPVKNKSAATGSDIHIFYPGRYGNHRLTESSANTQRLQRLLSSPAANESSSSDDNGTMQDFLSRRMRYRCLVTGSWNLHMGLSREDDQGESELAVQVVYLRLVGTRGCTKVTVLDQKQQSIFSCRPGLVTTVSGRQLKKMRAPLEVHIELAASIWEDDFLWLQFQSINDDPISIKCNFDVEEKPMSTSAATVTDNAVDWTTVITGLSVTGTLICVCLVLGGCFFMHRCAVLRFCQQQVGRLYIKRSLSGFGKYDVSHRPPRSDVCQNPRREAPSPSVQNPPFCHRAGRGTTEGSVTAPSQSNDVHGSSSMYVQPARPPASAANSILASPGSDLRSTISDTREESLNSAPHPAMTSHRASEAVQVVLYDETPQLDDLDDDPELEVVVTAHARRTEEDEDEGSSIDSTVFDFDSICGPGEPPSTHAPDTSGDYEVMARSPHHSSEL